MKRAVIILLAAFSTFGLAMSVSNDRIVAQKTDSENLTDNEQAKENIPSNEAVAPEAQGEAKESLHSEESLKGRKKKELEALRESSADSTEYTLDPNSVELVVELDPNGYGFRTRNHRMTLAADIDLILRGRGMLRYDYRFFNSFSLGLMAGVDWSDISLYSSFRQHMSRPSPWQFAIMGGVSGKWRLTEWYMRSSVFLEPSVLVGHMWQTFAMQNTKHWRVAPGLFGGVETVFDSGLAVTTKVGVEFPFDFGDRNAWKKIAEPLLLIGFGFAI